MSGIIHIYEIPYDSMYISPKSYVPYTTLKGDAIIIVGHHLSCKGFNVRDVVPCLRSNTAELLHGESRPCIRSLSIAFPSLYRADGARTRPQGLGVTCVRTGQPFTQTRVLIRHPRFPCHHRHPYLASLERGKHVRVLVPCVRTQHSFSTQYVLCVYTMLCNVYLWCIEHAPRRLEP